MKDFFFFISRHKSNAKFTALSFLFHLNVVVDGIDSRLLIIPDVSSILQLPPFFKACTMCGGFMTVWLFFSFSA